MDPENKSLNFIFPTKYVIPKSLKFSHWPSKITNSLALAGPNPKSINTWAVDPGQSEASLFTPTTI